MTKEEFTSKWGITDPSLGGNSGMDQFQADLRACIDAHLVAPALRWRDVNDGKSFISAPFGEVVYWVVKEDKGWFARDPVRSLIFMDGENYYPDGESIDQAKSRCYAHWKSKWAKELLLTEV